MLPWRLPDGQLATEHPQAQEREDQGQRHAIVTSGGALLSHCTQQAVL